MDIFNYLKNIPILFRLILVNNLTKFALIDKQKNVEAEIIMA